jgi:type I restriction enzyme S subunit
LISSTSRFVEFAKSCSSGTTNRQRINVNQFLLQRIPLPSLKEQRRLVNAFDEKINQAKSIEKETQKLRQKQS